MNALMISITYAFIELCIIIKQFDKIVNIHEQEEFTEDKVIAIKQIFHTYRVVHKYGLQLLYRHFTFPEETLILTEPVEQGINVLKVTSINDVDLMNARGQLYYLNEEGKFQAYKYEYGALVDIPEAFLTDLVVFVEHNIRDWFALAYITTSLSSKPFKKWEIGSQATRVIQRNRAFDVEGTTIEVNYWFEVSENPEGYSPIAKLGGEHPKTIRETYSVLYMSGKCSSLCSNQLFDFENCDIVEVLRDIGFIE